MQFLGLEELSCFFSECFILFTAEVFPFLNRAAIGGWGGVLLGTVRSPDESRTLHQEGHPGSVLPEVNNERYRCC